MSESKDSLRQEARRHRAMIDPASESAEDAARIFIETLKPGPGQIIAGYAPTGREFDSYPVMEKIMERGGICVLPLVQKDKLELKFAPWNHGSEMTTGPHGVAHPAINDKTQWLEPDIVIVPLLAFDRRGYRLGQGGGYYDATLAALRARRKIVAVGLAYAAQAVLFNLPVEPHDQKLDWVITPYAAHSFEEQG